MGDFCWIFFPRPPTVLGSWTKRRQTEKKKPSFSESSDQNAGFPIRWAIKCVMNQWVSIDLNRSFHLGTSSVSWSCVCSFCTGGTKQATRLALAVVCVDHDLRHIVFYPLWLLWPSECIGIIAFSMCSYNPLFSATQRQADRQSRRQKAAPLSYSQDCHLWPRAREILSASCQSLPTDKPCSLSDAVFLRCSILVHEVTVIHYGSWWQYVSYQRNMKEGVSQWVAGRPETSIGYKDLGLALVLACLVFVCWLAVFVCCCFVFLCLLLFFISPVPFST